MSTPFTSSSGAAYQGDRVLFADATGTPDGHARVARAVACLNACEGIEQPVLAIPAERAALALALTLSAMQPEGSPGRLDPKAEQQLRTALALLGGA